MAVAMATLLRLFGCKLHHLKRETSNLYYYSCIFTCVSVYQFLRFCAIAVEKKIKLLL